MTLAPGTMLGKYRVEEALGRGGMGEVFRAVDSVLGRSVALKIMRQERLLSHESDRTEYEARFLREARAAAATKHASVVALYDFGAQDGVLYIAMELVEGRPLRDAIGDVTVPMWTRVRWLHELAGALASIHDAGLVHRDVKPENVMVTREGSVKLLDFGIARRVVEVDTDAETVDPAPAPTSFRTVNGLVRGTPRYMAPEQRTGGAVDARADQYAWGLVAMELLADGARFDPSTGADALVDRLPHPLVSIIRRTISPHADERYETMSDVARAVAPFVHEAVFNAPTTQVDAPSMTTDVTKSEALKIEPPKIESPKIVAVPNAAPPVQKRRAWPIIAAIAIVIVGAGVAMAWRFISSRKNADAPSEIAAPEARFCWVDLATTDAPAAIAFYTHLFGWKPQPDGRGAAYTAMTKGDRVVGAIFSSTHAGDAARWASYVAVPNVDAALARATAGGGAVIDAPTVAPELGRMATVRDPTGAALGLIEPLKAGHARATPFACEPGNVCWNELWADASPKTAPFYASVIGWSETPPANGYVFFIPPGGARGVAGTIPVPAFGPTHAWGVYFAVDRCDDAASRAVSYGATVIVSPTDIAGVGRYAVIRDPQGAVFAIVQQRGN